MKEEKEILVEVKGLSKKFCRSLKRSMWYGLQDVSKSLIGKNGSNLQLRKDEFWAVKDISFSLRRGECLGLIGRNGAGKSTLLKMLNGLIRPDEGSITMRGKVGALIELGAGFNPILTGRENIYVNGQILGFRKAEIDEKMEAILDFADIGKFIDSPVQNYSSGMKVRLGFAIAAQMEPDILIIDEVLAVGDLGFVLKCFNTIDTLMKKTAVIFVSHGMPHISRVCTSVMLMEYGKEVFYGTNVSEGIDRYYATFTERKNNVVLFSKDEDAALVDFKFGNIEKQEDNGELYSVNHLDDLTMNVQFRVRERISAPFVNITISDKEQRPIGVCQNTEGLGESSLVNRENGFSYYSAKVVIPRLNLSKGIYSISIAVNEKFRTLPVLRMQSLRTFQVISKNDIWPPIEFEGRWA
jgi:lipopolysaccharide transport system ATP-binding protein